MEKVNLNPPSLKGQQQLKTFKEFEHFIKERISDNLYVYNTPRDQIVYGGCEMVVFLLYKPSTAHKKMDPQSEPKQ